MQRVKLTIKQYYFLRNLIKKSINTNVFYKDNRIVIIELSEDDGDKIRDLAALSHLMWALFSLCLFYPIIYIATLVFVKKEYIKKILLFLLYLVTFYLSFFCWYCFEVSLT